MLQLFQSFPEGNLKAQVLAACADNASYK